MKNISKLIKIIAAKMPDIPMILSLISLGFFGSFTHCSGMCGPFVLTQVSNRLENIPLAQFSNFQKLKNFALLPYHFGRITTYTIIGICCSFFAENIKNFTNFRTLSAVFLFAASLIFLNLFFEKNLLTLTKIKLKNKLPFKSKTLKNTALFFKIFPLEPVYHLFYFRILVYFERFFGKIFINIWIYFEKFYQKISQNRAKSENKKDGRRVLTSLFKNPKGLNGYFLGIVLGFIPCGLLYGAFLLAASISSPILAGFGMFLFGISTIPALFLTASGGFIFLRFFKTDFRIISKIIILINSVTLFIMAISLIN